MNMLSWVICLNPDNTLIILGGLTGSQTFMFVNKMKNLKPKERMLLLLLWLLHEQRVK